ncbi:uncharacterized protein [Antennarius striatus]|uniref:uncharacterized protein isoform X6 n=1 Tax=Antennarius striatus TaxID=241820 RepID=UPI0035B3C016
MFASAMEKRRKLTPVQDALEHIANREDKSFLEERHINQSKGRGVFTQKAIKPSSFVVEYQGHIFPHKGPMLKRKSGDTLNNYLFEFSWKGERWCVDASAEDGTLGRLVNDDYKTPNCEMKKIECEGKPHLCLFAIKKIPPGKEITYNYGKCAYPWRSKVEDSDTGSESEIISSDNDYNNDDADDDEQSDSAQGHGSTAGDSTQKMSGSFKLHTHQEDKAVGSKKPGSDRVKKPQDAQKIQEAKDTSFTKKNYCYVCGKGYLKIARHLKRHAAAEPDIAEAFAFRKKSKERKLHLENLRNRGNYKHNLEVLKHNKGELKVKKLPSTENVTFTDHAYCLYCKGMYKRNMIWRHAVRCPYRAVGMSSTNGEKEDLDEEAFKDSSFPKIPCDVWKILVTLDNKIATLSQDDFLLIELAQSLLTKYEGHPSQNERVKQTLHEMGTLLIVLQRKRVSSFEDAIKPHNFCKVVEAVKEVSNFDETTENYIKVSLAVKLVNSLKKIASIVLAGFDGNEQMMTEANKFLTLCDSEWKELKSQKFIASVSGQKVNNPSTLSFIRDVQVFYGYLEKALASAIENLTMQDSTQAYSELCRVILAQASALNKCPPEVSKMTLKAFQERSYTTQVLSKRFIRINDLSRTDQEVAVLLTSELVNAMTLLLSKRETCGVHLDNPYLFAIPNSSPTSIYHGQNCIRDFSNLCRAKKPEHLTWRSLHKHIARVFQILNLENHELSHLAKLLGQDIRADRAYYQSQEAVVELAKIAKLLLAMEKHSLEKFSGNTLEDIEIEDELEPDVEQGISENGTAERDDESEADLSLHHSDAVEKAASMNKQSPDLSPEQDAQQHIKACRDKPFLEERFIDPIKGSGVFTSETIKRSTFVVEYRGKISQKQTKTVTCDSLENYVFDFSWNGTNWCVDASIKDGSLGRLVNDDHRRPNCKMKKIDYEGEPHLCLFALRNISPGVEITYNYGESSYPWRSKESIEELNTSQRDTNAAASSLEHENVDDSAEASADYDSDEEEAPNCEPSSKEADDISDFFSSDEDARAHLHKLQRHYCYVCGALKPQMSRHLYTHRKKVPEIAEVFALPPSSKERHMRLDELRQRGNDKHNEEVLKSGCGKLKESTKDRLFAHCTYCKRMCRRTEAWLHMKKCMSKNSVKKRRRNKNISALIAAAESTDRREMSEDVSKLLETLKNDETKSAFSNDPLMLHLAQWCCLTSKKTPKKSQSNDHIKSRLRHMERLLLILKKKSICSFEEAVKPQNFSRLVGCVREIAGFNEEKKSYRSSGVLKAVADSLEKMGCITYAKALKEDAEKQTIREAETFIKLCENEWRIPYSPNVSTIPFVHDVQILYQHLVETTASAVQSLSLYEIPQAYLALLRLTLAHVSILNQKTADISRITFKSFNERKEMGSSEDAVVSQSPFEQFLSKHYLKIDVLNTKGKKVTISLTPELLNAVTLLANKREACGVLENNPFLFAKPADSSNSVCHGQAFVSMFISRCAAKNKEKLRSEFFREHVTRVFHILSLTNEELGELAKLLGHNIKTDKEYYQTPEAAVDVAKILKLLSAAKNGSLESFKGKSLEEIEIADELEPDVKQENTNRRRSVVNKASPLLAEIFSSGGTGLTSTSSVKKATSSKKSGQSKNKKQESVKKALDLNDEENTEKNKKSEETSVSHSVNEPRNAQSCSNDDVTKMSFSDEEEEMNVEFDIDSDEDNDGENDPKKEEDDGPHVQKVSSPHSHSTGADNEDAMDSGADNGDTLGSGADNGDALGSGADNEDAMDSGADNEDAMDSGSDNGDAMDSGADNGDAMDSGAENYVEKDPVEEEEHRKNLDTESRSSSATWEKGKNNKLSAANCQLTGMKEVKICLQKLDIDNLQTPIHISHLPSFCTSVHWPATDHPSLEDNNKAPASSTLSKDLKKRKKKELLVTCPHCNKYMLQGQTAFQKKGFKDVFCSKACLFAFFPVNTPATKTCYYCFKEALEPLDVIMATVNDKGTMKDFCSVMCLSAFKSSAVSPQPPQPTCKMCGKSCIASCELTLNNTVHKFCNVSCLKVFCRDNMAVCGNCDASCSDKPLKLKLEDETKFICSDTCLKEFKEKMNTSHLCKMCRKVQPVSGMVQYKTSDDTVELFCQETCVVSYKQAHEENIGYVVQGKRDSQLTEDESVTPDTIPNRTEAAPVLDTPRITFSINGTTCCQCKKKVGCAEIVYRTKKSKDVFCSTSCISENNPHIKLFTKKCYNCFQVIRHPNKMILAPVDESGISRELCSNACLNSVNSKRKMAPLKPRTPAPPAGPQMTCKMCNELDICKFEVKLDGLNHRLCSSTCYVNYHRVNNLPIFICDVCSTVCPETHLTLMMEDSSKTICTEECLLKFKEKVEAPQMCRTCMTTHRMSDMIESKSEEGWLDFFCSTRCLLLHKAQCFSGSERNPAVDKDTEEVKPVLLNVKEEPNDEEYNQNNSFSTLTEDNKDELKVDQSKHEIIQQDGVDRICSDPCNHRFCNMNNMSICDNCHSHCRSPVMLTMKEGSKKMCSAECMAQFKQNLRTLQPCPVCATYCLVVNMVENKNSEDVVELFCSSSCVKASKIQAVCASGVQFICDNCGKATVPAWHLAMSDDSIRNFCTQSCAMAFQETQNSAPSQTAVSSQTPEELPCAQCQCVLSAAPKIIETKDIIHLVCSLTCSEEFKRTNKITGKCEHCKNVRIINDSKRMGKKTCYFCSGGCRELFYQVLEKSWGKYCKSCAYCHCISKTVVAGQHKRKMEKFCSEECRSKHTKLLSQAAQCDTCSRQGKLTQSLALLRDVKHFCDLKCLLHFCSKNIQVVDTESSPQRPADTSKSFPVITNVISLAAALAERARAAGRSKQQGTDSERHGPVSVPDVPSKAVGHVSVQTVYKELKNKSMLCAPLAHNKGVSCATQTTNTKTQTDNIGPGVLPVPVPVYVPVPLLIPKHVCLPVPLPFPVCIPVTSGGPDLTVKPMTEQNQVDPLEENLKSEMKNTSDEKQEKEDRHDKAVTEGQHRQDAHVPNVSDALTPSQYPLELPPPSALDAPLWQETTGNDHNRNKQVVEDVNKETSQRGLSTSKSMKCRKLKSQCGIDAWKRWIQWRESQTNLYFVSI